MPDSFNTTSNKTSSTRVIISILYPLQILLLTLLSLTKTILLILTLPLQYAYSLITSISSTLFNFLAKFESLYYFFTTALLLGILAGTGLYYTTLLLNRVLALDSGSGSDSDRLPGDGQKKIADAGTGEEGQGRTAASYRAERAARQAKVARERMIVGGIAGLGYGRDSGVGVSSGSGLVSGSGLARFPLSPAADRKDLPPLLSTAIFEEDDSEEDYTTM